MSTVIVDGKKMKTGVDSEFHKYNKKTLDERTKFYQDNPDLINEDSVKEITKKSQNEYNSRKHVPKTQEKYGYRHGREITEQELRDDAVGKHVPLSDGSKITPEVSDVRKSYAQTWLAEIDKNKNKKKIAEKVKTNNYLNIQRKEK